MPTPAGYSGTPLVKKLGFQAGMKVFVHQEPSHYRQLLADLPADVTFLPQPRAHLAFGHLFCTQSADLKKQLQRCLKMMAPDGIVWVSWPKKARKVPTDITEETIRELALPLGLVDIKVCAVDEIWSGLKLMLRKELRPKRNPSPKK